MSVLLDLFSVRRDVAPDDVGPVRLEIPRRDENEVVVADPHPALYLAPDAARAHLAVGTLYYDVVTANQLYHAAQELALLRHDHLLQL